MHNIRKPSFHASLINVYYFYRFQTCIVAPEMVYDKSTHQTNTPIN